MTYSDRLAYKVLIAHNNVSTDYGYRTESATVTINNNAIPTLTLKMSNTDMYFYTNNVLSSGDPVQVEASADGGYNFVTLFFGEVADPAFSMSADGEETITITATGAKPFNKLYASPNQSSVGPTDITFYWNDQTGNIFQGSRYDRNGHIWSADIDGNYPNGLLYKTGYSLDPSSHFDFMTGMLDIPEVLCYNYKTIYELVKAICDSYGAMFWFDDIHRRILVRPMPVVGDNNFDFPYATKCAYKISRRDPLGSRVESDHVVLAWDGASLRCGKAWNLADPTGASDLSLSGGLATGEIEGGRGHGTRFYKAESNVLAGPDNLNYQAPYRTNSITMRAVFDIESLTQYSAVIAKGNAYEMHFDNTNGGMIYIWLGLDGTRTCVMAVTVGSGLVSGGIHEVIFTRDSAGLMNLFYDGVKIHSAISDGNLTDASEPVYIGAFGYNYFDGVIYEVHVLSEALSDEECRTWSSDFWTSSERVSLAKGVSINSIATKDLGYESYDKITVVGASPGVFYTLGTGSREMVYQDSTLKMRSTCKAKALQQYSRNTTQKGCTVTAPAVAYSIVGQRIEIIDDVHNAVVSGRRPFGNVVGVKHELTGDRWFTTISLECVKKDTPYTIAEIKERLADLEDSTSVSSINVSGDVQSSVQGANVAAIAFGDSESNIQISPLNECIADGTKDICYATCDSGKGRVTHIRAIANQVSGDAPHSLHTGTGIFQYNQSTEDADGWRKLCDIPDVPANNYLLSITSCVAAQGNLDGGYEKACRWYNASDCSRVRMIYGTSYYSSIPSPDDAAWESSNAYFFKDAEAQGIFAGFDGNQFTDTMTISAPSEGSAHGMLVLFEWDMSQNYKEGMVELVGYLNSCAKAAGSATIFKLYFWCPYSANWQNQGSGGNHTNYGPWAWSASSPGLVRFDGICNASPTVYPIDAAGKIRLCIQVTSSSGAALDYIFKYLGITMTFKTVSTTKRVLKEYVENYPYTLTGSDKWQTYQTNGLVKFNRKPYRILEVYIDPIDNGDGTWGATDDVASQCIWSDGFVNTLILPMMTRDKYTKGICRVKYLDYVYETVNPTFSSDATKCNLRVVYGDATRRTARVDIHLDQNAPVPESYLELTWKSVGGTVIGTLTADADSRIDQGICKDAYNVIHAAITVKKGGAGSGLGTFTSVGSEESVTIDMMPPTEDAAEPEPEPDPEEDPEEDPAYNDDFSDPSTMTYTYLVSTDKTVKNASGTIKYTGTSHVDAINWAQKQTDCVRVKLGPGTFTLTAQLRQYKSMFGSGVNSTYVNVGASMSGTAILVANASPGPSSRIKNVLTAHFTFDGKKGTYPVYINPKNTNDRKNYFGGLQYRYAENCLACHMVIKDFPTSHGIQYQASNYNEAYDIDVIRIGESGRQGAYGNGICSGSMYASSDKTGYSAHDNNIHDCTCTDCAMVGVNWEPGWNNTVTRVTVTAPNVSNFWDITGGTKYTKAVSQSAPTQSTAHKSTNNKFISCDLRVNGVGAQMYEGFCTFDDCVFYADNIGYSYNATWSIFLKNCPGSVVRNCTFTLYSGSAASKAVFMSGSNNGCLVTGCHFYEPSTTKGYAVYADTATTGCTITNNVCTGLYAFKNSLLADSNNTVSGNTVN